MKSHSLGYSDEFRLNMIKKGESLNKKRKLFFKIRVCKRDNNYCTEDCPFIRNMEIKENTIVTIPQNMNIKSKPDMIKNVKYCKLFDKQIKRHREARIDNNTTYGEAVYKRQFRDLFARCEQCKFSEIEESKLIFVMSEEILEESQTESRIVEIYSESSECGDCICTFSKDNKPITPSKVKNGHNYWGDKDIYKFNRENSSEIINCKVFDKPCPLNGCLEECKIAEDIDRLIEP